MTKLKKGIWTDEMLKASQDPLFIKDLSESIKAFETIDAESSGKDSERSNKTLE